tara:strand:- start:1621 stop:5709 length:4089 start_codon:yes stop_codon:yes gene_type:complete
MINFVYYIQDNQRVKVETMKQFYNLNILVVFFLFATYVSFAQTPSQDGQWSNPIPFGIVPVAVANLPDGRLITWSSQFRDTYIGSGDGATFTEIFDPFMGVNGQALGEFTSNTDHDMFCPGINNLADGRILSAGGTSSTKTSIYNPATGLWSVASEMNIPRGYQGNVTLSDGSVFTLGGSWSGGDDPLTNGGKDAEIWSPETGWTLLPGITGADLFTNSDLAKELQGLYRVDNHAWLWPAPNGQIFHAGPGEMMHWINVENGGSITSAGLRGNDTYSMKGTTVMFDIGKILKVGGAESYGGTDPAFVPAKDNSYVIDVNNPNNVTVTATNNNLLFSRTMHNSTVLPNGEVLVTGGLDRAEVFSDTGARLTAELYNPDTNSWRTVAGMATPRTYHSVGILMVDGRVFVGGGGLCDGSNPDECVNHFDAEIYSPPYLFNSNGTLATRPTIDAPEIADYNTSIQVNGSVNVQEFNLIRFSAATHSTNNEQRRVPLTFTGTNGNYTVAIPDRNLLPPGYYMLFALNNNGVPSIAETIKIGSAIPLDNNPNLVLSLDFEEGSGVSIADGSMYGNDAIISERDNFKNPIPVTQNYWTSNGLFGNALEMDGLEFASNSLVEIPYSSSMATIQNEITVIAWVYRDENEMNAGILSHDYPALFFGFHNNLYKWEFPTDTGGSINCYAGYVPTNKWVHIAATYDGQTARLFANGIEICTQFTTGNFILDTTSPNYSTFNISGFYDKQTQSISGITDELDGKIDQLRVYNKALGSEEILNNYSLGQLQNNPEVTVCAPGTILPEFKIGVNGPWQQGNEIEAPPGSEVFIRAQVVNNEEYFVTLPLINSPTFSSVNDLPNHAIAGAYQLDTYINSGDGGDGLIGTSNKGRYILTTASGCATIITLNILPTGECDFGPNITPEYRLDGTWDSGLNNLSVEAGTEVVLSILPNGIPITIKTPTGLVVADDHVFENVNSTNSGTYVLTTNDGCQTFINLTVNNSQCTGTSIIPEYSIDGVVSNGTGTVSVEEGSLVILSATPTDSGLVITLPDGTIVGDNYSLGNVLVGQSGVYTFTSSAGCTSTLTLDIVAVGSCTATSVVPQYSVDGVVFSGSGSVNIDEGSLVVLSATPLDSGLVITLPDGTTVGDNYSLGNVIVSQSGVYTFTSSAGCTSTLDMTVVVPSSCPSGIIPEYSIDGVWDSGQNNLSVATGTEVVLSMLPNGLGVTITLPDGTVAGDDYTISSATAASSGSYIITSSEGCSTTINLTVQSGGSVDNNNGSTTEPNIIEEISQISVFPNPIAINGLLSINLSSRMNEALHIGIYDTYGKLAFRSIQSTNHRDIVELNLSSLSSGVYVVVITETDSNARIFMKKIIKN